MMRFEIKYDMETVAQFSGYIDAMDYLLRQTKYNRGTLHLQPLPGFSLPDNIVAIMRAAFPAIDSASCRAFLRAWHAEINR